MSGDRTHADSKSRLALRAFFSDLQLRTPLGNVGVSLADPRALTRKEISRTCGLPFSRVELALAELRLLFLAPRQGQLPVAILEELLAWNRTDRYRLPYQRRDTDAAWLGVLPDLRATFRALGMTAEEREYAELLADPDMLNQRKIAEILDMSRNAAERVRHLLRVRLGARRRGQVRVRLLHAVLDHVLPEGHPPFGEPVDSPDGDGTGAGPAEDGAVAPGGRFDRDPPRSEQRRIP